MLTVDSLQQKRLPPWPPIDVVAAATHQRKAAIPGQVGTGAEEQDDPPKLRRPPNFRAKIIPAAAPHHAFPSIPELGLNWAENMSWLGFLYIAEGKICSSLWIGNGWHACRGKAAVTSLEQVGESTPGT